MTDFSAKVIAAIQQIPHGKVATYGQIAGIAGKPQGSRGVAWILNSSSGAHKLPWHRVLGAQGRISFPKDTKHHRLQKALLQKEGVLFSDNGRIDLKKFQWKKTAAPKKKTPAKPRMFG